MSWINIKHDKPKMETAEVSETVVIFTEGGFIAAAYYDREIEEWRENYTGQVLDPEDPITHWWPIPECSLN